MEDHANATMKVMETTLSTRLRSEGILPLRASEIQDDFNFIAKIAPQPLPRQTAPPPEEGSDSECSVDSQHILQASYPVRPRVGQAGPSASVDVVKEMDIEEALSFISSIKSFNVKSAELTRESLEIQKEALIRQAFRLKRKLQSDRRKEGAYLSLVQALFCAQLNRVLCRNIVDNICREFVVGLNEAINQRNALTQVLADMETLSNAQRKGKVSGKTKAAAGSLISVAWKAASSQESNGRTTVLFVGQTIMTPMGFGKITRIDSSRGVISIRLPFGVMYSAVERVANWKRLESDLELLNQCRWNRWKSGAFLANRNAPSEGAASRAISSQKRVQFWQLDESSNDSLGQQDNDVADAMDVTEEEKTPPKEINASMAKRSSKRSRKASQMLEFPDEMECTPTKVNNKQENVRTDQIDPDERTCSRLLHSVPSSISSNRATVSDPADGVATRYIEMRSSSPLAGSSRWSAAVALSSAEKMAEVIDLYKAKKQYSENVSSINLPSLDAALWRGTENNAEDYLKGNQGSNLRDEFATDLKAGMTNATQLAQLRLESFTNSVLQRSLADRSINPSPIELPLSHGALNQAEELTAIVKTKEKSRRQTSMARAVREIEELSSVNVFTFPKASKKDNGDPAEGHSQCALNQNNSKPQAASSSRKNESRSNANSRAEKQAPRSQNRRR